MEGFQQILREQPGNWRRGAAGGGKCCLWELMVGGELRRNQAGAINVSVSALREMNAKE